VPPPPPPPPKGAVPFLNPQQSAALGPCRPCPAPHKDAPCLLCLSIDLQFCYPIVNFYDVSFLKFVWEHG
jgi:hypothetical protein